MSRTSILAILLVSVATWANPRPKMRSHHEQLIAWSEDGVGALVRVDEDYGDGSIALGYEVVSPGSDLPPSFALRAPGITHDDCVAQSNSLRDLLARRRFSGVSVTPALCSAPARVVVVSAEANSLVSQSHLTSKSQSGGKPWFEVKGAELWIGRGDRVAVKLGIWPAPYFSHEVALSPSRRLLLSIDCKPHLCTHEVFVSASGRLDELTANTLTPQAAPADRDQPPQDLAGDRAWWDASAASPHSPVEVSFDPEGQHPFSCVRDDGAYWIVEQGDTGIRVERGGGIKDQNGSLGAIDERGRLHLRDSPIVRLDGDGRLYCRSSTRAFARIDRRGLIMREPTAERIGALHGDVDWQKNRRAAFLLLVDVCKLDQ